MKIVTHTPSGPLRSSRRVVYSVGPCQPHEVASRGGAVRGKQTDHACPNGPDPAPCRDIRRFGNVKPERSRPPRVRTFHASGLSPCTLATARYLKEKNR